MIRAGLLLVFVLSIVSLRAFLVLVMLVLFTTSLFLIWVLALLIRRMQGRVRSTTVFAMLKLEVTLMLASETATTVPFTFFNWVVLAICSIWRATNRLVLSLRLVEVLLVSTFEVANDVVTLARSSRARFHLHVNELLLLIIVLKWPLLFLWRLLLDCGTSLVSGSLISKLNLGKRVIRATWSFVSSIFCSDSLWLLIPRVLLHWGWFASFVEAKGHRWREWRLAHERVRLPWATEGNVTVHRLECKRWGWVGYFESKWVGVAREPNTGSCIRGSPAEAASNGHGLVFVHI